MNEKSLEADVAIEETPNFSNSADKLLKSEEDTCIQECEICEFNTS